jgi:succinyl-CoA synthetase beta subunit
VQVRYLYIHEYQAKDLLQQSGALVAKGKVARTPQDAQSFASNLGTTFFQARYEQWHDSTQRAGTSCVLKSQVLSGGRGKGHFDNGLKGGIQLVTEYAVYLRAPS